MNHACRKPSPGQPALSYARVTGRDGADFMVTTDDGRLSVRRAAGCLLEPADGDLVLVSTDYFGNAFVLSVLVRVGEAPMSLVFERDVELRLEAGRLSASAPDGIALTTPGELGLAAATARVSAETMEYSGERVQGRIGAIAIAARTCDTVFERVTQRVQRSYRWVAELEQLTAGQLKYTVEKLMSLKSKYAVVTAKENVKIDGKQIMMG